MLRRLYLTTYTKVKYTVNEMLRTSYFTMHIQRLNKQLMKCLVVE